MHVREHAMYGTPSTGAPAVTTAPQSAHIPSPSLPILTVLPTETMIPTLLVLFLASISFTLTSMLFNVFALGDHGILETFRQWSRVLWMSKAAHVVDAPTSAEAHRLTHDRHIVAVTANTTPVMSPVDTYDSAAFFRGIATSSTIVDSVTAADRTASGYAQVVDFIGAATSTPPPLLSRHVPAAGRRSSGAHSPGAAEMAVYHAENPPATVPAPVVAEALTNTLEAVRLESQRIIFGFHPYYIVLCAAKAGVMLLYIQYHFDSIEGGWRRFCICGAANIFSGLLTPVWEYVSAMLLPLDPDRDQPAVVKVDEEKTDSVFIVEVLLRISTLELDNLPTVLMQGSSFVAFAAVLVPLLAVFCVPGIVRYIWIYAPLWIAYVLLRFLYYRGAGSLPSSTARHGAAVVGMTSEMLKAFCMKVLTFFMVLVTVQTSFLLGLAWAEKMAYDDALQYAVTHAVFLQAAAYESTFQKVCLLSQLFL